MRPTTAHTHTFFRRLLFMLLILSLVLSGVYTAAHPPGAAAQGSGAPQGPWSPPYNLSGSGGVTLPAMVVDAAGVIHAIWQEDEIGYNYSQFSSAEWSQPVLVDFPFDDYAPLLVAGEDWIYAFWIATSNDDALFFSRVAPASFGAARKWEVPKRLSKHVSGLSASYQPGGRIHLAYIHALGEETQAEGIVYLKSVDKGVKWSNPNVIYTSKYFRSIKPDDANVQIAAVNQGENDAVSVVWDNPAIKRVFFAQSIDSGATWRAVTEVDGPSFESESSSPFKIRLAAEGNQLLRIWQGNLQSGVNCSQFYQYSNDNGRTWSDRTAMFKNVRGCATKNDLMVIGKDGFLLQSVFPEEVYLAAFDGVQWSEPQLQTSLTSFENPNTSDQVTLECQNPTLLNNNRLYVIGCTETSPADAWVLWRAIEDVQAWFPRPSAWGIPLQVALGEDPIYAVQGAADRSGRVHILWTQRDPVGENANSAAPETRSLYYAVWDGEKLSEPASVITSPDRYVGAFSLAYDPTRDRLSLVWEAGKRGEIYFSWADVASAASTFEWAAPVTLPLVEPLGRAPNVAVRNDGVIFVAYTIPVNEYRGVYLVKSADGGVTWSQPVQIYKASGMAQMVDRPRLALAGSGTVHILWAQNTVLSDPGPVSLAYAVSSDGGDTWPAPIIAVNEPVEAWWILSAGKAGIQRFWTTINPQGNSLFQDISVDSGVTWSLPTNLTGLGETLRAVDIATDASGGVTLAQVVGDSSGALSLRTQNWVDAAWAADDTLLLDESALNPLHSLVSAWLPDGRHAIIYAIQRLDAPEGNQPWEIVLRVRNPKAGEMPEGNGTAAPTNKVTGVSTQIAETPAASTPVPATPAGSQLTAAPQATQPPAAASPAEASPSQPSAPGTQAANIVTSATPAALQTPLPANPPAASVPNSSMGLYLAVGISLLVAAAFFAYSRYRRSS